MLLLELSRWEFALGGWDSTMQNPTQWGWGPIGLGPMMLSKPSKWCFETPWPPGHSGKGVGTWGRSALLLLIEINHWCGAQEKIWIRPDSSQLGHLPGTVSGQGWPGACSRGWAQGLSSVAVNMLLLLGRSSVASWVSVAHLRCLSTAVVWISGFWKIHLDYLHIHDEAFSDRTRIYTPNLFVFRVRLRHTARS